MIVDRIILTNYRNYSKVDIELYDGLNILIGDNGAGKTNILESLTVVSNGRSFRCNEDINLIKKGDEYARIDILTKDKKIRVIINQNGKNLMINNDIIKKMSDFIGKLNVVLFKPDDLEIFVTSPRNRRRMMDLEIGKVSFEYLQSLLIYSKLIKDKNLILKQDKIDELYLDTIDDSLVAPMKKIIDERSQFIDFINSKVSIHYQNISASNDRICIRYVKCCEADDEMIRMNILQNRQKDLNYHYATFGIQKDDFEVYFNDGPIADFASQGQKRMVVIAVKFALVEYIYHKTKSYPILLLDDILSELDIDNKNRLLSMIPKNIQTIITSTDVKDIKLDRQYRLFKLKKGQVIR